MRKRKASKPLTDAAGEVRELTIADMKHFKPASPELLRKIGVRGPQKAPTKQLVSLRLSRDVLTHYQSTGPGWQARIDQALRESVKRRA